MVFPRWKLKPERDEVSDILKNTKVWTDVVEKARELEQKGDTVTAVRLYNASLVKFSKNKFLFEHLTKLMRRIDISESMNIARKERNR